MRKILHFLLLASFLFFSGQLLAAPINLNTADAATLATTIKGIGMKKAEAIVAYRETNGPFKNVDDLAFVKGIGQKTVEKNKENLRVIPQK